MTTTSTMRYIVAAMPGTVSDLAPPRLAPWPQCFSLRARVTAFFEAVLELFWMDVWRRFDFRTMRRVVARTPLASATASCETLTLVRVAVRDASIFYVAPVHCLQRSAAVTRMLRRRGLAAQLIIGYQPMPLSWHAWVELNGEIVWDRAPGIAYYHVVDRV